MNNWQNREFKSLQNIELDTLLLHTRLEGILHRENEPEEHGVTRSGLLEGGKIQPNKTKIKKTISSNFNPSRCGKIFYRLMKKTKK